MSVLRLIRIDFDNLENRQPKIESTVGVFTSDKTSAHDKATAYFNNAPPQKLYLGYDNNVYPIFKLILDKELN